MIGVLGLSIVSALLSNETELLSRIVTINCHDAHRLRLILATQVLGDPGPQAVSNVGTGIHGKAKNPCQQGLSPFRVVQFVFLIPVVVAALTIADDLHITDLVRQLQDAIFGRNMSGFGATALGDLNDVFNDFSTQFWLSALALLSECGSLFLEWRLFGSVRREMTKLLEQNRRARSCLQTWDRPAPPVSASTLGQ